MDKIWEWDSTVNRPPPKYKIGDLCVFNQLTQRIGSLLSYNILGPNRIIKKEVVGTCGVLTSVFPYDTAWQYKKGLLMPHAYMWFSQVTGLEYFVTEKEIREVNDNSGW